MNFDKLINKALNENEFVGGMSDNMTLEDIADKHNTSIEALTKQLQMGIKVESEHSDDRSHAREIAMDHLVEDPKYYTKLSEMENESMSAGPGGVFNPSGAGQAATGHGGAVGNSDWYNPNSTVIPKGGGTAPSLKKNKKKNKKKKHNGELEPLATFQRTKPSPM